MGPISSTISFSQLGPVLLTQVRVAQSYVMDGHWAFLKGGNVCTCKEACAQLMHELKGETPPISKGRMVLEIMQNGGISDDPRPE